MRLHHKRYVLAVLTDALRQTRRLSFFGGTAKRSMWCDGQGRSFAITEMIGARVGLIPTSDRLK